MIGRMFQRRGNQLVEVTNPSVILADTSSSALAQNVFYVSPNGDNTSDGLTENTALATIGEAINRISNSYKNGATVYLAGGTYDETVIVDCCFVKFDLQGDVTITGDLDLRMESVISVISSNNAKFTADYIRSSALSRLVFDSCSVDATTIIADTGSFVTLNGTVTSCVLRPGDGMAAMNVIHNSHLENKSIATSVVGSNSSIVYAASEGGIMYCYSPTTITGSFTGRIFNVANGAGIFGLGNVNCTASCYGGINCGINSFVFVRGITMTVSNYTGNVAVVDSASTVHVESSTFTFTRSGSTADIQIIASDSSLFNFVSGTLSIRANGCNAFLASAVNSHLAISGTTLALNGSVTNSTAHVERNGVITIPTATTISGTVTGRRYAVATGGQINVGGAGANRIPGNAEGTVSSDTYGYYG